MMTKKPRTKALSWGEPKQRVNLTLTQHALDLLDEAAGERNFARSQMLEWLIREEYDPESLQLQEIDVTPDDLLKQIKYLKAQQENKAKNTNSDSKDPKAKDEEDGERLKDSSEGPSDNV
jgi:hypothetical protein